MLLLSCATDTEIETTILDEPIALEVSAVELRFDYDANDVAGDLKYKDKVVALTGYVSGIHSKDSGGASVTLRTDNFVEEVRCHFTETHMHDVANLREGDWVKFRGQVEGKGLTDIFDISVRACSLLEHRTARAGGGEAGATSPPPAPTESESMKTLQATTPVIPTSPEATTSASPSTSAAPVAAQPVSSTPTVAPISTSVPTQTPIPPGGSLSNPVAAGEVLIGSDGLEMVVTGVVEIADELVEAENYFNDPPAGGNHFYLISLAVANLAAGESATVSYSNFNLIGENRVVYEWYENGCGVIPNQIDGEIFEGGRIQGNICFEVPTGEGALVIIHQPDSFGGQRSFLSVDPEQVVTLDALTAMPPDTPSTETLTLPPGMKLGNPVAAGDSMFTSDGLQVLVTDTRANAWELVKQENSFNEPPADGHRFYLVTIDVTNASGAESMEVAQYDFSLVGNNRLVYTFFKGCGVIPNSLSGEIFQGGKTIGNLCFQVIDDDHNFVLMHDPGFSEDGRRFLRTE